MVFTIQSLCRLTSYWVTKDSSPLWLTSKTSLWPPMFATSASRQAIWIPDSLSTVTTWTVLSTRGLLSISNLTLMSWWVMQCINTVRVPVEVWWLRRHRSWWPVDLWWDWHLSCEVRLWTFRCHKQLWFVKKKILIFFITRIMGPLVHRRVRVLHLRESLTLQIILWAGPNTFAAFAAIVHRVRLNCLRFCRCAPFGYLFF